MLSTFDESSVRPPFPNALASELSRVYGDDGPSVMLALLVGLSGLTHSPVSARIVGNSMRIEDIGLTIEEMIGLERCRYFSDVSDDGIASLGDKSLDSVRSIICAGEWKDERLRRMVGELVLRRPLCLLDGSPTGWPRYRKVDRRLSFLLLRADDVSDPAIVGNLLTLRVNRSLATTKLHLTQELERFLSSTPTSRRTQIDAAILTRLNQISWNSKVEFCSNIFDPTRVRDSWDGWRTAQALSLASVWRVLSDEVTKPDGVPTQGNASDIQAIIDLIEQSQIEDERYTLCPRDARMLEFLKTLPAKRRSDATKPASVYEGFTYYEVQGKLPQPSVSIDTIRLRIIALQKLGFVEPKGRLKHRDAFALTEAGVFHKSNGLAEFLRDVFQIERIRPNSECSEQVRSEHSGVVNSGSRACESEEAKVRSNFHPQETL